MKETPPLRQGGKTLDSIVGAISLQKVEFAYPDQPDIRNVSIHDPLLEIATVSVVLRFTVLF